MPKVEAKYFPRRNSSSKKDYLVTKNSRVKLSHFIPSTHLWRRIEDILFYHSEKNVLLKKEGKKICFRTWEESLNLQKEKNQGFCSGVQKMFGLFLFYHLSWFLAGPFYWIIEKKLGGGVTFSSKAEDSKK